MDSAIDLMWRRDCISVLMVVVGLTACERAPNAPNFDDAEQHVVGRRVNVECARKGGQVACRGDNERGLLGGGTPGPSVKVWTRIRLPGSAVDIALSEGESFACALLQGGKLWCWGLNLGAVLGDQPPLFDGDDVRRSVSPPVQIRDLSGVEEMHLTVASIRARDAGGKVYCWGQNTYGEAADPREEPRILVPFPHEVPLPKPARSIFAFATQTCALLVSGELYCWGGSVPSDHAFAPAYAPTLVARNVTAVSISKDEIACAATGSGDVCWPILDSSVRGQFDSPGVPRIPPPQ